jgi:hypothetical protein
MTRSAICRSRTEKSTSARNSAASLMASAQISEMFLPPMRTARISGFRRAPLHWGQGTSRM